MTEIIYYGFFIIIAIIFTGNFLLGFGLLFAGIGFILILGFLVGCYEIYKQLKTSN